MDGPIAREIGLSKDILKTHAVKREPIAEGIEPDRGRLVGLSRINLFVGPNNAGKSRLLRSIFNDEMPDFWPGQSMQGALLEALYRLRSPGDPRLGGLQDKTRAWLLRDKPLVQGPSGNGDRRDARRRRCKEFVIQGFSAGARMQFPDLKITDLAREVNAYMNRTGLKGDDPEGFVLPRTFYIPTLRGLRLVGDGKSLWERSCADYAFDRKINAVTSAKSHRDMRFFTGQEAFGFIRSFLLGFHDQRVLAERYQEFLSQTFFRGRRVTLVPVEPDRDVPGVLHIKIGDEPDRPIHTVGDGIAQIIILTLPMFLLADRPTLFLIEEPEMHLHPGYQRMLIDAILHAPGAKNRQVFATTHSHHLLDTTLQHEHISIYRCRDTGADRAHLVEQPWQQEHGPDAGRFEVELLDSDRRPLLRELGVFSSSLLLANCTIWVEGVTDRDWYRHCLRLYQDALPPGEPHFREDVHFAFVEYGGSNLPHWSIGGDDENAIAVEYLCAEGLLIVDRDGSLAKDARHALLQERLGDRFVRLSVREVENLVSRDVLIEIVREWEGDEAATIRPGVRGGHQNAGIGGFIERAFFDADHPRKRTASYAAKSGTIDDKAKFSRLAVRHTAAAADLSIPANDVCKLLYCFIAEHQPDADAPPAA